MSFDIFLVASSESPPGEDFDDVARRAVLRDGGTTDAEGVNFVANDGMAFELYGGTMFALRGLSQGVVKLIGKAAVAANAFIVPASEDQVAYRLEGVRGKPPKDFMQIVEIGDATALFVALEGGYGAWRAYADRIG